MAEAIPIEQYQQVMNVCFFFFLFFFLISHPQTNYFGMVRVIKAFLPLMRQRSGRVYF
jgi:NAD(P)-dependent dehydrogenase (short-subunit alcohol dehydrogenase family)